MRKLINSRFGTAILFAGLVAVSVAGALLLRPVGNWFIRSAPINYEYICEKNLADGHPEKVLSMVEVWVKKHYYDFRAHYLEAQAYEALGQYAEAADVMKLVLRKLPAARARNLPLSGFDEPKTYEVLSGMLWKAGKYFEAAELGRVAWDEGKRDFVNELLSTDSRKKLKEAAPQALLAAANLALKAGDVNVAEGLLGAVSSQDPYLLSRKAQMVARTFEKRGDKVRAEETLSDVVLNYPAIPGNKLALANFYERDGRTTTGLELIRLAEQTTGTKVIGPGMFERTTGFNPLGSTGVEFLRNGDFTAKELSTGAFRVCNLLVNGYGAPALGVSPIVVVKADGVELTRIYMDSDKYPQLFDANLWPDGASKKLDFTLEFVNDIWDPYTKADRNVFIRNIMLY